MGTRRKDPNQLSFDFSSSIEEYVALKTAVLSTPKPVSAGRSYEEDCIALAVGLKEAIVESGMSRDQVADEINVTYGWPTDEAYRQLPKEDRKTTHHLSLHMLNHYLSKPVEYKLDGYLIFAIQRVTRSLATCNAIAKDMDAQVISGDEKRDLTLGKLDVTILEMQRLKRELRGRR